MKIDHKHQIQNDIPQRRSNQKVQRRPGIAQGGKHSCADIIQKQEDQPTYVYVKIECRIAENISRSL